MDGPTTPQPQPSADSTVATVVSTILSTVTTTLAPSTAHHEAEHTLPLDVLVAEQSEATHKKNSMGLLILVWLLTLSALCIWLFKKRRVRLLHETGVSMILGAAAGLIIDLYEKSHGLVQSHDILCNETLRIESSGTISEVDYENTVAHAARFDPEVFFFVLLPPIMFQAGYGLNMRNLWRHIGVISGLVLIGTCVGCFGTGALVWVYSSFIKDVGVSLNDAMTFGALISATDPVTVLAIFHDLHVDPTLYSIVFGESGLNDATSIVLFSTMEKFKHSEEGVSARTIFKSIFTFFVIFIGSFCCGLAMGMISAFAHKYTKVRRFPILETTFFILMSYSTYLMGEAFGLTGIVAVLFCGVAQKHYTYYNLGPESQRRCTDFFELLNVLAENFIFSYIGLSIFLYRCHIWDAGMILWALMACIISRCMHVLPISFIANRFRTAQMKITKQFQFMIVFAGLRGAVAFALAMRNTATDAKKILLTTTLSLVLITVLLFGGSTTMMLQKLKIRVNVHDEDEDADDEWAAPPPGAWRVAGRMSSWWQYLDENYILPVLTPTKNTQPGTESWTAMKRTMAVACGLRPPAAAKVQQLEAAAHGAHHHGDDDRHPAAGAHHQPPATSFEDDLALLDEPVGGGAAAAHHPAPARKTMDSHA